MRWKSGDPLRAARYRRERRVATGRCAPAADNAWSSSSVQSATDFFRSSST
ncbi:hypothetical protein [Streptomyces sp. MOE7]|uniref:hypothetical protein n=1 Tax=Streptomyces sp. MOE7 TaxID=1961713 RepID=UPI00156D4900|nr:hypothetical protein [Streptomyces sp. MOE7]